ncbi:MAG TPA: glycosyltransferase [Opitutaceae bacterium]|nr:glycosyltransferase [Opitutaceae bacterium]
MIYFDITKTGRSGHRSGLNRVSERLRAELGDAARPVSWTRWNWSAARPADWFLTGEIFGVGERPGLDEFLRAKPCRLAAIFHDAIPLRHPQITWPQSVARHPGYMKSLARFDRIWAVSAASREDLLGYWRWIGVATPPPVDVLAHGADFDGTPRVTASLIPHPSSLIPPSLLCIGIVEPRKNQGFLLDVCAELWREGLAFELHLVGRVNPHFGAPIVEKIQRWRREFSGLHYHAAASDAAMAALYAKTRATVFPTIAEGCGLPVLESLWQGVPCVCSDLPMLRENADGGGCVMAPVGDLAAWQDALRRVLTDDAVHARLVRAATTRTLPTWAEAAQTLRTALAE